MTKTTNLSFAWLESSQDPAFASCLDIRRQVFVQEQEVQLEEELDGRDPEAFHVLAFWQGDPVATARILPLTETDWKLQRIAVLKRARRSGIGRQVLSFIEGQARHRGMQVLQLSSQAQVAGFYEKAGFRRLDRPAYLDARILHYDMAKDLTEERLVQASDA